MTHQDDFFTRWLKDKKPYQRVMVLLIGLLIIFLIWYDYFGLPEKILLRDLRIQANHTQIEYDIAKIELQALQNKMANEEKSQRAKNNTPKTNNTNYLKTTAQTTDKLIKQFFNLDTGVRAITLQSASLKLPNSNENQFAFNIQFNSSYFETINYLARLEKLPWCLSWDNLNYQVTDYPEAVVNVKLHTLNEV